MTRGAGIETAAALLVGLVIVGLGATFSDPGDTQPDLRTSSYVNDPGGTRGLFEVVRACGLLPERLVEPPQALPDTHRTVVVAAPSEPFGAEHVDAFLDWVAAGGRAVVVAAKSTPPLRRSFHAPLLFRLGLHARERMLGGRGARVVPGTAEVDATVVLAWPTAQVLDDAPEGVARDPRAGAPRTIVASRAHRLVVAVPFGTAGGEVVVFADPALLTNEHLRTADNAVFAVELLAARPDDGGRVVFDEYHHGFRPGGERAGVVRQAAALLWTTWPGRGVLVLVAAWVVLLAGRGVRLGTALPDAAPPRRKLSEHAEALGRLLEKSRARAEALRVLAAGARRAVGPRAGLPTSLPPARFHERLAASPAPGAGELAAALDEAERLRPSRDADVARAARRLAAARRHYLHGDLHRGR